MRGSRGLEGTGEGRKAEVELWGCRRARAPAAGGRSCTIEARDTTYLLQHDEQSCVCTFKLKHWRHCRHERPPQMVCKSSVKAETGRHSLSSGENTELGLSRSEPGPSNVSEAHSP